MDRMRVLSQLVDAAKRIPGARTVFDVALDRVPGLWALYRRYKHDRHPPPTAQSVDLADPTIRELKKQKLKRIREILACPNCGSSRLDDTSEHRLTCQGCSRTFERNANGFDFLSPELREQGKVRPTENISANEYYELQSSLVTDASSLVLDHGCGMKKLYHPNVVYYEIVEYASTDVRGIAEQLPFRDNSFDAVVSIAVLEHVREPFKAASEILRVLKPGGKLHVDVPFLQPFHGYPDHYYNMTRSGLLNLFEKDIVVERCEPSHDPIKLLPWWIRSYCEGLPPMERKAFLSLRLDELLSPENVPESVRTRLSAHAKVELAFANVLVGKKR